MSAPQRVLSLCFGGGLSTVAAGMLPQAKRFDMVDISRENVELALKYFLDNARWQDDARVRFHFEDAFRFLRQSAERWDLILAEPTPPYFGYRGAVFYTVEFFRNAAAHLTPDGVFSMPLPCGQMTPEQARSVMKSFAAAFPFCRLWWNGVDPVMTGSLRPMIALVAAVADAGRGSGLLPRTCAGVWLGGASDARFRGCRAAACR